MVRLNVLARSLTLGKASSSGGSDGTITTTTTSTISGRTVPNSRNSRNGVNDGNVDVGTGRSSQNDGQTSPEPTGQQSPVVMLSAQPTLLPSSETTTTTNGDRTKPQPEPEPQPTVSRRRSFHSRILRPLSNHSKPASSRSMDGATTNSSPSTTNSGILHAMQTLAAAAQVSSSSSSTKDVPPPCQPDVPSKAATTPSTKDSFGGGNSNVLSMFDLATASIMATLGRTDLRRRSSWESSSSPSEPSSSFIPPSPLAWSASGPPPPHLYPQRVDGSTIFGGTKTPSTTTTNHSSGGIDNGAGRDTSVSIASLHKHRSSGTSSGVGEIKLNFDRLQSKLFGRDEEREQLWEAFRRVCNPPPEEKQQQQPKPWVDVPKMAMIDSAVSSVTNGKRNSTRSNSTGSSSGSRSRACVQTVFIHGPSGVGKSRLVEDFHSRVQQQTETALERQNSAAGTETTTVATMGTAATPPTISRSKSYPFQHVQQVYYLQATYPQQLPSSVPEPFSAFTHALVQLGRMLVDESNRDDDSRDRIRKMILDGLALQEIRAFIKLCPDLKQCLMLRGETQDSTQNAHNTPLDVDAHDSDDNLDGDDQVSSSTSMGNSYVRAEIGLLFLRLIRLVGRPTHPIVLFLDDVQWADPDSLDLISTMVHEEACRHFLLIVAFREDVTDGRQPENQHSIESAAPMSDDASSRKLSVYSIISRKATKPSGVTDPRSGTAPIRVGTSTSMSLAQAPKWSSARTRTNFLMLGHNSDSRYHEAIQRTEKLKVNSKDRPLAGSADKATDTDDADIAPPVTFLRKAVTIGSYNPSRLVHSLERKPLDLSPLKPAKPTKQPIPEPPTQQIQPTKSSLIDDDDDTDEDDHDLALFGPMPVPRPIPFAQTTSSTLPPSSLVPPPPAPALSRWSPPRMRNKTQDSGVESQEISKSSHTATSRPLSENEMIQFPPSLSRPTASSTLPRIDLPRQSPNSAGTLAVTTSSRSTIEEIPTALLSSGSRRSELSAQPSWTQISGRSNGRIISPLANSRKRLNNNSSRMSRQSSHRTTNLLPSVDESSSNANGRSFASNALRKISKVSLRTGRPSNMSELTGGSAAMSEGSLLDFPLSNSRHATEEFLVARYTNVTDIPLGNLDVDCVCEIISYLTSLEMHDCVSLGSVVTKKTHGNPTSVLRFLEILHQDGLIRYSMRTYRWEWDAENINNSTTVTNDVGELLAARIKHLPRKSLAVLKLAACIGFSFHTHVLEHLAMEDFLLQSSVKTLEGTLEEMRARYKDDFRQILDESLHAGLVEVTDQDNVYRFSHDLIHQNLYAKIKDDERKALHLRIARVMRSKSYYGSSSRNLFITVNHFNSGYCAEVETDDERMHVVELNLQASVAARAGSSFRSAAIFLDKAIAILKGDDWSNHYLLVLEVFSSAAEVHFSCGDLQQSTRYAEEVVRNARCTEDQIRGHFIKVDILGRERRYTQALKEGFRILGILGCKIPRYMKLVHLYKDLARIKTKVRGKTSDDFLAMKPMTDVVQLSSLRLMDTMTLFFALKGDVSMAGLLLTRMMLTTLKNGHSIYSPFSFASYGMLLYYLGDAEGGHRYGTLGLRIAEKLRSKRALTRTAYIFYTFLNHLRKPLTDGIEPMLNAHRMGLQVGDIDYSSMCLSTYANLYVAVGLPLQPYMEDMKQFCEQLELYHQSQALALMAPFRQLALNLMGNSENPLVLSGDAMNLEDYYHRFMMDGEVDERDQDVTYYNLKYATLMLAYIFQDMGGMQEWFRHKPTKRGVIAASHFDNLYVTLFSGLAAFALHRETGKRKYYRQAQRELSAMNAFAKKCGINAVPMCRLLMAERQSRSKDWQRTVKCYDEAISTFARCGLIHLEAIACERAGDYMAFLADTYWSRSYYSRSQMRYMEWGAIAKAEQMNTDHQLQNFQFKSRDDDGVSSTTTAGAYVSLRGRRRYDPATWQSIAKADMVGHQGRSSLIPSRTER